MIKIRRVRKMSENLSIYFTSPCVAELCESELREVADNEVLVKLAVSTVSSGTERANLIGDKNVRPSTKAADVPFPASADTAPPVLLCRLVNR